MGANFQHLPGFNRKIDTGTWSIAAAFCSLVIFSALFVVLLGYAFPTCACREAYEHLSILPAPFQITYAGTLFFFLLLNISSLLVIYGTFKVQENKLILYVILMILTEVSVFVGSIFIFKFIYNIEGYLLLDNDTYAYIAELILKKEVQEKLTVIMENLSGILRLFLKINAEDVLNLNNLMDAALKEEVLAMMGGMKQMMKVSIVIIMVGINFLFVASIVVVASHLHKLRTGILSSYSGVPEMVIHRSVLSGHARGAPSDSLSDASGTPLQNIRPPLALPEHHYETKKGIEDLGRENHYTRNGGDPNRSSRRTRVTANGVDTKPKNGSLV